MVKLLKSSAITALLFAPAFASRSPRGINDAQMDAKYASIDTVRRPLSDHSIATRNFYEVLSDVLEARSKKLSQPQSMNAASRSSTLRPPSPPKPIGPIGPALRRSEDQANKFLRTVTTEPVAPRPIGLIIPDLRKSQEEVDNFLKTATLYEALAEKFEGIDLTKNRNSESRSELFFIYLVYVIETDKQFLRGCRTPVEAA